MAWEKIRCSTVSIILTSLFFLISCAAGTFGGAGAQWSPQVVDKSGYHIHYAKPPQNNWAVFEDPDLEIAFYNKETGAVIAFDADHQSHTKQTDLKKAFDEFQEELQKNFQGKLSVLEESAMPVLGYPGYFAKVEGVREKNDTKVYFHHYFLLKDGKIMTFDFTQSAENKESKRQQDLEAFKYFVNSFQIH